MDNTITIQKRSKALKLQLVLSAVGIIVSIIAAYCAHARADVNQADANYTPAMIIAIASVIWYAVTKIRIWWNHS